MIHFIAGLPRSGSTLLAALLSQNPALHAGISTPVRALVARSVSEMSSAEDKFFFDDAARYEVLRSILKAIYPERERTYFDTNRIWTAHMSLLEHIAPHALVICCVRNLGSVINSFERLFQAHPAYASKIFRHNNNHSVYQRAAALMDEDGGLIESAHQVLKEAWFGPHAKRLLVIDYERLCQTPLLVLGRIYERCNMPWFKHSMTDVHFEREVYDQELATPGLHTISGPVHLPRRDLVIPPDLYDRFKESAFWLNPPFNMRGVEVLAPLRQADENTREATGSV